MICEECANGRHQDCQGANLEDTEHFLMVDMCCCGIPIQGGYPRGD